MLIIEPLKYRGLQLIKSAASAKGTPEVKDPTWCYEISLE